MVLATLWLLDAIAQHRVTAWLSTSASRALVLAATSETPYRWKLRSGEDIVAGRVFGAVDISFSDAGLSIRSNGT
ncbi:MAG TPA: hypothetical protein VFN13_05505, partial [Rudaea sp.]|nr:hypothetical protein [Rudaea sp.]